jgi:hypothetical protein
MNIIIDLNENTNAKIIDGKYCIVCELGMGGMGVVYEGENMCIYWCVVIKVLHVQVVIKVDIV